MQEERVLLVEFREEVLKAPFLGENNLAGELKGLTLHRVYNSEAELLCSYDEVKDKCDLSELEDKIGYDLVAVAAPDNKTGYYRWVTWTLLQLVDNIILLSKVRECTEAEIKELDGIFPGFLEASKTM